MFLLEIIIIGFIYIYRLIDNIERYLCVFSYMYVKVETFPYVFHITFYSQNF